MTLAAFYALEIESSSSRELVATKVFLDDGGGDTDYTFNLGGFGSCELAANGFKVMPHV